VLAARFSLQGFLIVYCSSIETLGHRINKVICAANLTQFLTNGDYHSAMQCLNQLCLKSKIWHETLKSMETAKTTKT
jgi:hypothetical protein